MRLMAEGFSLHLSDTPFRASPDVGGRFISTEQTCTVPHANSASVTGETFNTKEKVHLSCKPKWHALANILKCDWYDFGRAVI